jgi:hypothetical protein
MRLAGRVMSCIGSNNAIAEELLRIGGGPWTSTILLPLSAALVFLALDLAVRRLWGRRLGPALSDSVLFGAIVGAVAYAVHAGTFVSWVPAVGVVSVSLVLVVSRVTSARVMQRVTDELELRRARLAAEDTRTLESLQTELQSVLEDLAHERALAPDHAERVRAWHELRTAQAELRDLRKARFAAQRRVSRGVTRAPSKPQRLPHPGR